MPKLLMLKGLPGSGKSTYARQLVREEGYKRVNMDDLRRMLDDGKWSKANEKAMQGIRAHIVEELLCKGYDVVVDDTNFHPKHEKNFHEDVKFLNDHSETAYEFSVKFIDTPLKECIANDLKREHSVGKDVIMRMYNQYLKPPAKDQEWDPALPSCIIVDIDGTVARMVNRGPYQWNKVGDDAPKQEIIDIIQPYFDSGMVIFMSGRDSVCREATERWLLEHVMPKDFTSVNRLYMRPEGDNRPDTVIKQELYEEHVKGKFNVEFILDDRDSVVELWRNLGMTCLQVAEGDF